MTAVTVLARNRSQDVVDFLASLAPVFVPEWQGNARYARSLVDGSLCMPLDAAELRQEEGWIRVSWNGEPSCATEVDGTEVTTIALERYVRLHGVGYGEDVIAAELWYMSRHFTHKTGFHANLPQLNEPPGRIERIGRQALEMGQGVLVGLLKKLVGIG